MCFFSGFYCVRLPFVASRFVVLHLAWLNHADFFSFPFFFCVGYALCFCFTFANCPFFRCAAVLCPILQLQQLLSLVLSSLRLLCFLLVLSMHAPLASLARSSVRITYLFFAVLACLSARCYAQRLFFCFFFLYCVLYSCS